MKYLLIIVLLVAVVITTGCVSENKNTIVTPTQTTLIPPSIHISTTSAPLPTTNTLNTSTTAVQPTVQITSDDIRQHFMDTAFGAGSNSLYRLSNDFSYGSDIYRDITRISIDYDKSNYAQDSDSQVLQNFASEFNKYSKTLTLRENRWDSPAELRINVISTSDFKNIIKSPSIIAHNGVIFAKSEPDQIESIIYPSQIIISNDLKGNERNFTIVRGLLYKLGFRGETLKYKDSIFYSDNSNNPNLSYIDKKVIEIMYGSGMYPGMTVEDARKIVFPK